MDSPAEFADEPQDFIDALREFLRRAEGTPFWDSLWWSHTDLTHFDPLVDLLARHTDLRGTSIVDTGCGSGGLLIALSRAGAKQLVGVELDEEIARLAELRLRPLGSARIVTEDAALAKLEPASYDVVTSIHVIEHVTAPDAYLESIARLLRPGGLLLLACPNRLWPTEPHSRLPLVGYLPRSTRLALSEALKNKRLLPRGLRARFRTVALYETGFSYWTLRRLMREHGFGPRELNPPALWSGGKSGSVVRLLDEVRRRLPPRLEGVFVAAASNQLIGVFRLEGDAQASSRRAEQRVPGR